MANKRVVSDGFVPELREAGRIFLRNEEGEREMTLLIVARHHHTPQFPMTAG
jgi:hypothetical protein